MKETIEFSVVHSESTKPSKVAKVMIKSTLHQQSSTLTNLMKRTALLSHPVKRMDMVQHRTLVPFASTAVKVTMKSGPTSAIIIPNIPNTTEETETIFSKEC